MSKEKNNYILGNGESLFIKKHSSSNASLNFKFRSDSQKESEYSPQDEKNMLDKESSGTGSEGTETKIAHSNLHHTGYNYVNSIIGAGIIGIPYAIYRSGIGLGIILLVFVAFITDYSLRLLVKAGIQVDAFSYQQLVQIAFGRKGYYVLSVMQFTFPFIAMTSYNVIIGDTLPKILMSIFQCSSDSLIANRHFSVILATILITLPLSLLRNISRLAKVSFLSLVLVVALATLILVRAVSLHPVIPPTPNAYSFFNSHFVQAIGVMALTFMCHHNVFLIFTAMKSPNQKRWDTITHISVVVSLLFVVVVGITGYITFTGYSQGDILVNYCDDDITANLARSIFIVTIMLTFPIQCFVTRDVIETTFFLSSSASTLRQSIVTIIIVICIFVLSCLTKCLKVFLEFNGVLVAVPLAYIFPSIIYLKVDESPLFSWKKIPALVLSILGALIAIVGAVQIAFDIIEGISCSDSIELPYCVRNSTL